LGAHARSCCKRLTLPTQAADKERFLAGEPAAQALDGLFRLLREDMLGTVREVIAGLETEQAQQAHAVVFSGARVCNIATNPQPCVVIAFNPPAAIRASTAAQQVRKRCTTARHAVCLFPECTSLQADFWKMSKLSSGGLRAVPWQGAGGGSDATGARSNAQRAVRGEADGLVQVQRERLGAVVRLQAAQRQWEALAAWLESDAHHSLCRLATDDFQQIHLVDRVEEVGPDDLAGAVRSAGQASDGDAGGVAAQDGGWLAHLRARVGSDAG